MVNSSQGGGTKDTWVLDATEACSRAPPTISTGLSRYIERAENLARILEATQRLAALPLAYAGTTNEWESAVATAGCARRLPRQLRRGQRATTSPTSSPSRTANPSSIRTCLETARTNARAVRTALTVEMWDAINGAWLELQRFEQRPHARARSSRASCAG